MDQREFAVDVVRRLQGAGYQALWAGGCVRDLLLGKPAKDYDVATDARPEAVQQLFGPKKTRAVGAAFGVILVHGPRGAGDVEVATFRSEGPYLDGRRPEHVVFCTAEEDAQRRDFTINGLFLDPLTDTLFDYVGGQDDLRQQRVRAIGDPYARFREDKLRMLRAVRFAATLEFKLDEPTAAAVRDMAADIHIVSAERITQELKRMLVHRHRVLALELMRETFLLTEVFPELRTVCDPADNEADFGRWNTLLRIVEFLPEPGFELALAAVLSETPAVTAAVATEICRRLRFSNDESEQIVWLIVHRGDVDAAPTWGVARLKRLLAQPLAGDLLALHKAAALARGLEPTAVAFCEEYLRTTAPELINPPAIITGNDLIAHGLRPGPRFKRLLEDLRDAQLEGRIATTAEALALADQLQNGLPDAKT